VVPSARPDRPPTGASAASQKRSASEGSLSAATALPTAAGWAAAYLSNDPAVLQPTCWLYRLNSFLRESGHAGSPAAAASKTGASLSAALGL